MEEADKPLTDRQRKYVQAVSAGQDSVTAALSAGYGKAYAQAAASRVGKIPSVAKAILEIRQKGCELAAYTLTKAMEESLEVIEFAKAHKNPMAYFKAVEHRAKLSGLLVEQLHIKQEVIDLASALKDARTRLVTPPLTVISDRSQVPVVDPFAEEP